MKKSHKETPVWRAPSGRWTPADGKAMVAAYEESGLSMAAFAAKHGVGTQRVAYWRSRTSATGEAGGFVPVAVVRDREPQADDEQVLEVSLRCGRSVRVSGRWSDASIRAWVRALEASS